MVDLMLGNDPRAFSLGEVYAWFHPYRTDHFSITCSCGQSTCPWNKLKTLEEDKFYAKSFDILDVDVLVDSSKNLTWVIDNNIQARKEAIDVFNVLLYKEPVSFFYSYWKRGFSINKARKDIFIKYYRRFFQSNLPFTVLNYNKLVADPASTLESLCQLLGISYFEGKQRFWEKEHHYLFGSMGLRKDIERKNLKIRDKEDYPSEFQSIIPQIEADNLRDKKFQAVLSKLKDHEMQEYEKTSDGKIYHRYWYYAAKLKKMVRRRFPEKWHDEQENK